MHRDLPSATDAELLRLSAGSADAFAVFYRRYERLVVGWLVRRTGRPDLAAELAAEVFSAAYLAAPRFRDGPEPAGAWLLGIARHKLLRSLRRDRIECSARRRLAVERVHSHDEALAAVDELRDCGLLALLDDLPADQRAAITARVIDEVDYTELAATLQVSPTTARKRVSRGLLALRAAVAHQGDSR
jgi:RNA polymerase sigma-70 factor (ECF subfamily)